MLTLAKRWGICRAMEVARVLPDLNECPPASSDLVPSSLSTDEETEAPGREVSRALCHRVAA